MTFTREGVHTRSCLLSSIVLPAAFVAFSTMSVLVGCGGASRNSADVNSAEGNGSEPSSPETGATGSASTPSATENKDTSQPATQDPPPKTTDAPAAKEDAASPTTTDSEPASEAGRNVKYVVSPEGLRVEVEGVSFSPKGEAVKAGGGYTIRLKVEARAKDGKTHSILAPDGKELAFAGTVKTAAGGSNRFGDKREGDRSLTLADKPLTLKRSFPAAGEKPLSPGDELELMVGLWGLGGDVSSRRPLNKFFRVTVKLDKEKPRVVIAPPEGTTKD